MIIGSSASEIIRIGNRDMLRKINDRLWCDGTIVPVHYVSDGASIPQLAWSVIGHPFQGRFRRPAYIHDIRCELKVGTWQDTHSQFLDTLDAEGVGRVRRRLMFGAVWLRGPRWPKHEAITYDDLYAIVTNPIAPNGRPWGDYGP